MNGSGAVRSLLILVLGAAALSAAPGPQTFTGVITDDQCANANHSHMRMGETDAECAAACVDSHGAQWVLFDGKNSYTLSDQQAPAKFAGKAVRVVGELDARSKSIKVTSITQTR